MKIKIIGLGNVLMGDDGVGIYVVNELLKENLPDNVEIIEGASCGWGLINLMEGAEKVILVDAIYSGQEAGSIVKSGVQELKEQERIGSPHQLSLLKTLELAEILGNQPEVLLIGVSPADLRLGSPLSSAVEAAIPKVVACIREELNQSIN